MVTIDRPQHLKMDHDQLEQAKYDNYVNTTGYL